MSKLTGLHFIFRKNSIYGANIGFHTLTFTRSLGRRRCLKPRTTDLVVIEGHLISQGNMDEVLGSVVLPSCAKTSDSTKPRMTMSEHTSQESAKTMLCVLTGLFIRHVDNFNRSMTFWTEGLTHNNDIKKPPAFRCSVAGDIDADPSAPNHQYSEYAKQVLVLICR